VCGEEMPQAEPKIASAERDFRWFAACLDGHLHGNHAAEDASILNQGALNDLAEYIIAILITEISYGS
jgi:hypothetical protein